MSLLVNSFRQSFQQLSPAAKLILLVLIALLFIIAGSFLAFVIAIPVFHIDMITLNNIIANPRPEMIGIVKFFQIFQSVTVFILPAILAAWLFGEKTTEYLKTNKKPSIFTLVMVLLSLLVAVPALNMVTSLNMKLNLPEWLGFLEDKMILLEKSAARLTELFLISNSLKVLIVNFIMIAILPAIGEELMFRGVVQRLLTEWTKNAHIAIILSAFIFSFIHLQFYGFLPRFLLGLYFGYLFFWSGSIWVPITGHLMNNGLAVLYYHFSSKPMGNTELDTIGTGGEGNFVLYLSVFFTSLLLAMIYLHEKGNKESFRRNFL